MLAMSEAWVGQVDFSNALRMSRIQEWRSRLQERKQSGLTHSTE